MATTGNHRAIPIRGVLIPPTNGCNLTTCHIEITTGNCRRISTSHVVITASNCTKISSDKVYCENQAFDADTVVIAVGQTANRELLSAIEGMDREFHAIGDCVTPRRLLDAIHEGFGVANRI